MAHHVVSEHYFSAIHASGFLFFLPLLIMMNYCVKPDTVTSATNAGAVV